ncbi:MAG: hypothetical protein DSY59_00360 [Persephonella sp.]|nr:MAG: hypothetical protein DSY60_00545 [Persephonella sp.]RUM62376.1 MAG: hypothetical protein DSY59_00360 [Persephonella sp.]
MSLLGKILVRKREDLENNEVKKENLGIHPLVSVKAKYKELRDYILPVFGAIFLGVFIGVSAKLIMDNKEKFYSTTVNVELNEVKNEKNMKNIDNSAKETKLVNINQKNSEEKKMFTNQNVGKIEQNKIEETKIVNNDNIDERKKLIKEILNKARIKELSGDLDEALVLYKKAWVLDRKNVDILYKLAVINFKIGYFKNSIKYADEILKIKKDFIPAILIKGKAYEKLGMFSKAQTVLEEAYFYYPENKDLVETLAKLYEKQGDYLVAKDYYEVLSNMGYIEGDVGLAKIYEKLGDKKKAYEYYKKVYENPNIPDDLRIKIEQKLISLEDSDEGI